MLSKCPGQVTLSQDEQHQRKQPENQRVFRKAVEQDRGNQTDAHAAQPSAQRDRQIKNGQLAGRRSESVKFPMPDHGEDKQPQRMNCKYPERTARGKIKRADTQHSRRRPEGVQDPGRNPLTLAERQHIGENVNHQRQDPHQRHGAQLKGKDVRNRQHERRGDRAQQQPVEDGQALEISCEGRVWGRFRFLLMSGPPALPGEDDISGIADEPDYPLCF